MGGKVQTTGMLQGRKGNGKKDLHPNSRRVKQATRVDLRNKKVAIAKKERVQLEKGECARLQWFVKELDSSRSHLDIPELHQLVDSFIHRLDDEIAAEQKERRAGRPRSKRHEELETAKARDEQEYAKQGLLTLDLTDKDSVISARYWDQKLNGKAGYLPRLRLVRIFKDNDELVLEQSGEAPGTKAKDAGLEVEETEMQE